MPLPLFQRISLKGCVGSRKKTNQNKPPSISEMWVCLPYYNLLYSGSPLRCCYGFSFWLLHSLQQLEGFRKAACNWLCWLGWGGKPNESLPPTWSDFISFPDLSNVHNRVIRLAVAGAWQTSWS